MSIPAPSPELISQSGCWSGKHKVRDDEGVIASTRGACAPRIVRAVRMLSRLLARDRRAVRADFCRTEKHVMRATELERSEIEIERRL